MLRSLSIENFRGLRSFQTEIAAVTALLGPNSSGKTTVLHAIRLAAALLARALENEQPVGLREEKGQTWIAVAESALLTDVPTLLPLKDWRALFVDQQVGEGTHFSIELTFDDADPIQALRVRVACGRNEQLKLHVSVRSHEAVDRVQDFPKKSPRVNQELAGFVGQHAPRAVLIPPFYGTVPVEELRSRAVIDRMLGSGDQSHVVRNLLTGLDSRRYELLNAFLQETVGARLTARTTGDALQTEPTLRVEFRDSNGDVELSAAGAGLVNLVALYAALSRWGVEPHRNTLFLLDEPEAHLHPRLQAESASRFARLVTQEFGAQLVVATHSVDILNRLSEDGATLVRCDRNATPSAIHLTSDADLFNDLSAWVDLSPYTAINALASRRVLFVEGSDELKLLPRLAELRFRHQPEKLRRYRRWAPVPLGGAKNAPDATLLARLVSGGALRHQANAGDFQAIVVLDRDYEREPGLQHATADGLSTLTWSQHSIESLLCEPTVLTRWVRAFLGSKAPADVDAMVERAISETNADPELFQNVLAALVGSQTRALHATGVSLLANEQAAIKQATRAAYERAQQEPAIWQRGHDRARAILGRIRAALGKAGGQLPTDIVKLIAKTNLDQIGEARLAIPNEVNELFELMTRS